MTAVPFIHGAVSMGCALVAVRFHRWWRASDDRLFAFFAAAFAILSADYALLGLLTDASEYRASVFAIRLAGFVVLLIGIIDKNRR